MLFPALASADAPDRDIWSGGTARTLPQGRMERGIFLPLRWGATDRLEVSAFPIAEALIPNARLKVRWRDGDQATLSTLHALAYPTPLMNFIARDGTGGILPATSEIPPMLTIKNGVLMTRALGKGHDLTTDFYVTTTPRFGGSDFTTIDFPVVYSRTASYHTALTFRTGLDVRGPIAGDFGYRVGADLFVLPGLDGSTAVEQTTRFGWSPGPKFRAMIGYQLISGRYPFGPQVNMYPLLDVQFAWDVRP